MRSGAGSTMAGSKERKLLPVTVSGLTWLADHTFEMRFQRPERFEFLPGQKIGLMHDSIYRDYSLISSTHDSELAICVRLIPNGNLSPILARAKIGDGFNITTAFGFFYYQPGRHPAVFVATGTGIAPFVAFVRAGAKDYHLLHGVKTTAELYYRDTFTAPAKNYTPCVSASGECKDMDPNIFHGRVTTFLERKLKPGIYDFYLCGKGEMIRDAVRIIDAQFGRSRVFTELFF